jgi:hypothetical protein
MSNRLPETYHYRQQLDGRKIHTGVGGHTYTVRVATVKLLHSKAHAARVIGSLISPSRCVGFDIVVSGFDLIPERIQELLKVWNRRIPALPTNSFVGDFRGHR